LARLLHTCDGLRQTRLSHFPCTSAATMRISASTRTPKLETSLVRVLALCGACPVKIDLHHHLLQSRRNDHAAGHTHKKKAKCARSSESLPTRLLCNQYNPECEGKSAIRIRTKFRGYLKKTIVNL
jgi:hypothetical protein